MPAAVDTVNYCKRLNGGEGFADGSRGLVLGGVVVEFDRGFRARVAEGLLDYVDRNAALAEVDSERVLADVNVTTASVDACMERGILEDVVNGAARHTGAEARSEQEYGASILALPHVGC